MLIILSRTFSASLLALAVVEGSRIVLVWPLLSLGLGWFWMICTESLISETSIAAPRRSSQRLST